MFECKIRPHRFKINMRTEKLSSQVQKDVVDELKSYFQTEEILYIIPYNYRRHLV